MLRIVVETCDAGMAANVGGSVDRSVRTFDIEAPELETFLREYTDRNKAGQMYWHRRAIGVEVLPNKPGERICDPSAGSKYAPPDGSTRNGE